MWDGSQLVLELSESGKVQKRYVRGNGLVYADKGTDTEKEYPFYPQIEKNCENIRNLLSF